MNKKIRAYSVLGNIAVVNFPKNFKLKEKKKFAQKIMRQNKSVKSVLEKSHKFSGRLRKMQTKHILGEKTKEVLYKENGCIFRFNIDDTYFSPRLSNERKEIASKIKKNSKVLVMFAGVAPYSITIAKNSNPGIVVSSEINRKANKYAKLNIELNKVKEKVVLFPGDIKKTFKKIKEAFGVFDFIVMPRPRLKESFLKEAFELSKKGTEIYYYDFCSIERINDAAEKIKKQAGELKKKIKIMKIKKAGEIAPGKARVRIDFRVL